MNRQQRRYQERQARKAGRRHGGGDDAAFIGDLQALADLGGAGPLIADRSGYVEIPWEEAPPEMLEGMGEVRAMMGPQAKLYRKPNGDYTIL